MLLSLCLLLHPARPCFGRRDPANLFFTCQKHPFTDNVWFAGNIVSTFDIELKNH
jgi:hypothetical protein